MRTVAFVYCRKPTDKPASPSSPKPPVPPTPPCWNGSYAVLKPPAPPAPPDPGVPELPLVPATPLTPSSSVVLPPAPPPPPPPPPPPAPPVMLIDSVSVVASGPTQLIVVGDRLIRSQIESPSIKASVVSATVAPVSVHPPLAGLLAEKPVHDVAMTLPPFMRTLVPLMVPVKSMAVVEETVLCPRPLAKMRMPLFVSCNSTPAPLTGRCRSSTERNMFSVFPLRKYFKLPAKAGNSGNKSGNEGGGG